MNRLDIRVCIPSYKRPKVETLDYIPWAKVYVDEGEYEEYKKQNPEGNIISVPKGIQGNVSRIRNYILDVNFEDGADAVAIIDDDMKGMYRWENKKSVLIETDEYMNFLQKFSIMAKDMGVYLWGVNINQDKQVYREYSPFSTLSFIGGPFGVFMRGSDLRYDEKLPLKEDYDMTLQQLNKYRKVLRVNSHFYVVKQSVQTGGCAVYRNYKREEEQLKAFQKKWGSKIVKIDGADRSNNLKKKRVRIDYNPIIKVPIKGI